MISLAECVIDILVIPVSPLNHSIREVRNAGKIVA